jgi:succinate-semialdehyde dehydrogenase/glutarate-semialdehyde dehydrogenase
MAYVSIDPATGKQFAEHASLDEAGISALLERVHSEQRQWRSLAVHARGLFIDLLGTALGEHREELAQLLTQEMGKPITAARAEVDKCVTLCRQAPKAASLALAAELVLDDPEALVRVEYQPLGNVLAVMPWNFPHWQALRFAVPALLAGNGVIVKPAGTVGGSALLIDRCVREAADNATRNAGLPAAPLHFALIEVEDVERIIADDRIVGVTLTGSDRAGRAVAAAAGAHLKKAVLELGGSDPYVVLPSANVKQAAKVAAAARTVNSGQSCIAAKRFIVCDAAYDEFLDEFTRAMRSLVVGDPRNDDTQVGPIATESVHRDLTRQLRESIEQGARALVGGVAPDGNGFWLQPTVLVDVPLQSPAAREELFGPIAPVFRVPDIDAAIALANDSPFGLGASVWSTDDDETARCIAEIESGMIFINDMVVSDPRYPFGGVKQSGMGRELGEAGYREFTNIKTVRVAHDARTDAQSVRSERIVGE